MINGRSLDILESLVPTSCPSPFSKSNSLTNCTGGFPHRAKYNNTLTSHNYPNLFISCSRDPLRCCACAKSKHPSKPAMSIHIHCRKVKIFKTGIKVARNVTHGERDFGTNVNQKLLPELKAPGHTLLTKSDFDIKRKMKSKKESEIWDYRCQGKKKVGHGMTG